MQTVFQKKLATIAQGQFDRFHLLRENQPPLSTQIQTYWEDLDFNFPGVSVAWSAVFISWCVKNAQAGTGVFHGHSPSEYAPKIGDILQNNRSGHHFDFDCAKNNQQYESHSAIVIEVGTDNRGRYLRTIGGNEADSVGLKEVRLNARGLVKNNDGLHIAVIETLL